MRKLLTTVLAIALALSLLTGCSGEAGKFIKLIDEDYDAACEYYYFELPNDRDAMTKTNEALKKEVENAVTKYEKGKWDYNVTIDYLTKLAFFTGCMHEAEAAISELRTAHENEQTLAEAQKSIDAGECLAAYLNLAAIKPESGVFNDAEELRRGIVDRAFAEFDDKCSEMTNRGDFAAALNYCSETAAYLPENDKLAGNIDALRHEIGTDFEKEVIKQSDMMTAQGAYSEAEELLTQSMLIYDSGALAEAREKLPQAVFSLSVFTEDSYHVNVRGCSAQDRDNLGNSGYSSGRIVKTLYFQSDCFAEWSFLIEGAYRELKGDFFTHFDAKDETSADCVGKLLIYADGNLLYTSPVMRGGVEPVSFELNVSGVKQLTLRVEARREHNGSLTYGLADCYLFKQ